MATVQFHAQKKQCASAMKAVLNYCKKESKTTDANTGKRYISGINCNPQNAYKEFMATKNVFDKTNGVYFYHYSQSFSPDDNVSCDEVHDIALEFAKEAWTGHEVLVTTHCDTEHIHSHFVINSVSFETGAKLHQPPDTLKKLRKLSDEICIKHGLKILPKYENGGMKLSSREYRTAVNQNSWKFNLMANINEVMNVCKSKDEFIFEMNKRGFEVTWTDERKYITYTCPNGKKCRDIRLHDEKYLKGSMEDEFKFRQKYVKQFDREEQELDRGYEVGGIQTDSVRNPESDERFGDGIVKNGGEFSAEALRDDIEHPREKGTDRLPQSDTSNMQSEYGGYDGGECGNNSEPESFNRTGWEESREIYFGMGQEDESRDFTDELGDREYESEDTKTPFDCIDIGGGIVDNLLYSLGHAASVDVDADNAEERKRKYETKIASSNVGALVGLSFVLVQGIYYKVKVNDNSVEFEEVDEVPTGAEVYEEKLEDDMEMKM